MSTPVPDVIQKRLQENLAYFQQANSIFGLADLFIKKLSRPPKDWVENAERMLASPNFTLQKNNIWYHSRKDPFKEARRLLATASFQNMSHLVLIGSGLGYLIEEVLPSKKISSLLLIEPDLEMLFYILIRVDWTQGQPISFAIFFVDKPSDENFEILLPYLRGKDTSSLCIHVHSGSVNAFPELYVPVQKKFKDLIYKRQINQSTVIKFQKIWNKNMILNLREIMNGGTFEHLLRTTPSESVLVAGAGPSLEKNLDVLRKYKDRVVIFAVDTSYMPLIRADIVPDIVFSSDPQFINRHYVLSKRAQESLWILDPVVCPAIPHWLSKVGALMLWWDNPFYLDSYIRSQGSRGKVSYGGSISTSVFDVAVKWGAKKIILMGQDLAFTDQKAHAKGCILEELIYLRMDRFHTMEMHNREQMNALPKIWLQTSDKHGLTFTNAKLKVYLDWFENKALKIKNERPELRLIRVDAKGVFLNSFENLDLEDAITSSRSDPSKEKFYEKKNILGSVLKENKFNKTGKDKNKLLLLKEDIQQLYLIYQKNKYLILQYKSNPKPHVLKEVDRNDQKILAFKEANHILSLNAQKMILNVTESETEEPIAKSLSLYSSMEKTAMYMLYLLKKI